MPAYGRQRRALPAQQRPHAYRAGLEDRHQVGVARQQPVVREQFAGERSRIEARFGSPREILARNRGIVPGRHRHVEAAAALTASKMRRQAVLSSGAAQTVKAKVPPRLSRARLGDGPLRTLHMMDAEIRDRGIEARIGERQRLGIAGGEFDSRMETPGRRQHGGREIDAGDPRASIGGHLRRRALAARNVEQAHARLRARGLHQRGNEQPRRARKALIARGRAVPSGQLEIAQRAHRVLPLKSCGCRRPSATAPGAGGGGRRNRRPRNAP